MLRGDSREIGLGLARFQCPELHDLLCYASRSVSTVVCDIMLMTSPWFDALAVTQPWPSPYPRMVEIDLMQDAARYGVVNVYSKLANRPDYAEANAPPMLNYGWVYPQALLIFTLTMVFSVVSPLILVFGALYFGASCKPSARLRSFR